MERTAGLIMINADVDGVSYNLPFDTGATTILDQEKAMDTGMKLKNYGSVGDSQGNRRKIYFGKIDQLSFEGFLTKKLNVMVAPFQADVFRCLKFEGLLGSDVARHNYWKLDFEKETVSIFPLSYPLGDMSKYTKIPFETDAQHRPWITVNIDGKEVKFLVDTGSNGGFDINTRTIEKKFPSYNPIVLGKGSSTGLYGRKIDSLFIYQPKEIKVGNITIDNALVDVKNKTSNKVGMELFKHYITIFDWSTKSIYLKPIGDKRYGNPVTRAAFGIEDGKIGITTIMGNDPNIDLKIGDELIEANGVSIKEHSLEEYCEVLNATKDAKTIRLKVKKESGEVKEYNFDKHMLK